MYSKIFFELVHSVRVPISVLSRIKENTYSFEKLCNVVKKMMQFSFIIRETNNFGSAAFPIGDAKCREKILFVGGKNWHRRKYHIETRNFEYFTGYHFDYL